MQMEELLRESACTGNLEAVQKLLQNGSAINSQNSMNGWTALHWACKRGHTAVAHFLLQSGADASVRTHDGHTPLDVASTADIAKLLGGGAGNLAAETGEQELPIVPNYLANPPFPYYDITREMEAVNYRDVRRMPETADKPNLRARNKTTSTVPDHHGNSSDMPLAKHLESLAVSNGATTRKSDSLLSEEKGTALSMPGQSSEGEGKEKVPFSQLHPPAPGLPLLLKVRVAGCNDSDFVEVELCSLSYQALLRVCCEELEVQPSDVLKIRKLPNVWVRKDRDVKRMREGQELEVVVKPKPTCSGERPDICDGIVDDSRT